MMNALFFQRLFNINKSAFPRFVLLGLTCLLFATPNVYAVSDFGDAPSSYGDASHTIVDGLYLGETVPDAEVGSQHSFNAFGDGDVQTDGAGTWYFSGDEDGAPRQPVSDYIALFPVLKMTAMSYSVSFRVTNNKGGNDAEDGSLFGWIDFDGNGTFDADEGASVFVADGSNNATVTLSWAVPVDIKLGSTFIRLRLTTDASVTTSTPTGAASDGEVEDFVLAVALDIPPDSTNLTVLSGETPMACQSVVLADDFDDVAINGGAFLAPNRGAGGGSVETLRDWALTGGGADSYARVYDASAFSMGSAIYLGNGAVRRISPAIGSGFSFDSQGRITDTIDAIELRDTADDSTPGSTLMGQGTASHWGPEPIKLSRSFVTETGKTYRLYFKAVPEDGSFDPGAMRIDLPGGSVHIKIPGSDEDTIDYAIEFTALGTISTLAFVNYGHVHARGGIGWCDPVSEYANNPWCTVGGGDVNGNELIIDEVTIAESGCGSGSISGVVYTDINSNDSLDTPIELGINAMAVTLFDDNGTAADLTDDIQLSVTNSDASGAYAFTNVDVRKTYRLDVDTTDPDLPGQLSIGTANPLTGIVVAADADVGNQNFGFDPFIYSCPASGAPQIEGGFAATVALDQGVAYEQHALGALTAEGTAPSSVNSGLIASSDVLVLDLGEFVPEAAILQLSLARNGSQGEVEIAVAPFNKDYNVIGTFGDGGTLGAGAVQKLGYVGVLVPAGGARFVRLTNVTASTWIDGVSYNALCAGADDVAEISGTVYRDSNGNDVYDAGTESGLSSVTVSLLDDADASVIAVTASDGNGAYRFAGLPADKVYRVSVDTADSSLPTGASLGTVNPLAGVAVVAGAVTTDQDFGFDIPIIQSTFACDANIYIGSSPAENVPAQFHSVDTEASPFGLNAIGDTAHGQNYNAMGYREQDNYLYAIKQTSSNLLRIGADGNVVDLGAVSGLPVPSSSLQAYDAGDVFPDGYLYIHEVTAHPEIYKIDVTTTPPSLVETINLSQSIWLSDFAYNKVDNKVYGVGDQGEKFMIDPTNWAVSTVGSNAPAAVYGAAYTDGLGNVYVYKNNPGTFYRVDFGLNGSGTGVMIELSAAPDVSFNDGASCRGVSPVETALDGKVWFDTDGDGIQNDGADSYIEGATVELFNPLSSTVIASTTSNASGEYQFSSSDGMQPGTAYLIRIIKLDDEHPVADWAITSLQAGTDTALDSDAVLIGNYWQIAVTTSVSGVTSGHDFGFTNSSSTGCLEPGSNGISNESIANAHANTYDFLFKGKQVVGYCAEKGDADPAAGDNYLANQTDRQSLTALQREKIARGFAALTDPDIVFQTASAFGSGRNQRRLDDLMQYITWYYTDWNENMALLDSQTDSNSNYTVDEQTAMKALARTVVDRINGANGEAQYPLQDIFWLWNMTDAGRQDIVVPAIYAAGSSCSVPSGISGKVYIDNNSNDIYDSGPEPGIGSITVSLLNDADSSVLASTSTATDGNYSFTGIDAGLTYRVEVDANDADLAEGMVIGTTNPLSNISVLAGSTVANQNFGFDDPLAGCSLVVTTTDDSDSVENDSGSLRDAIDCANATEGPNTITFNIPTTDPEHTAGVWTISPASPLPILTDTGTTIDASTQPGAACGDLWATSTERTLNIQLDGAAASSAGYTRGLDIQSDNFALRGLSITNFLPGVGVFTQPGANNSRFTCNHIGVATDGMTAGSNSSGMDLRGENTYLGDVGVGNGNIISGNSLDGGVGVAFNNADTSYIYNNFFGTGLDGVTAVPNRLALWNISSPNMQVGGPSEGQRNLFSGNSSAGITFRGPDTDDSSVQGNYIGTDKTGLIAVANQSGINFGDLSVNITIGGSGAGEGNVISGNTVSGIASDSDVGEDAKGNFILGNIIGLDKDAANALPNQDGIALYEVDDFVIQENTIARNSRLGILLQRGADNVVISNNSIFSNALQGIDLQSHDGSLATRVGVTVNDTNDLDSGANGLLNFPVVSKVELSEGDMIVQGCAPANSIVEIFKSDVSPGGSATPGDNQFGLSRDYGEGESYLFSAVEGGVADKDVSNCAIPGGDGSDHSGMQSFFFVVPIPADVMIHDVISATATVPGEGTSEFGPMVNVTDKPPTIGGGSCPANGGTDILFIVDNSGSISESEFSDFSKSIQDVGSSFLTDNPSNRIAVAHFGGPSNSLANGGQHVYLERDFSSDSMIAPVRQFGKGGAYNAAWTADHLAGAVQQMRYALDGNAATSSGFIISPLREMSRNSAIPLQVVLMTDASRYLDNTPGDISMLIDPVGSGAEPNDSSDFTIYNQLKGESIVFSVVSFNVSSDASAAAGAIASVGGAYTGSVDSNSADPEGSQVIPRRYVPVTTGFVLELDQVSEMVDSVAICGNNISGVIFEDTVYGGGNGRAFGGFGTVGLSGATIEVYDGAGDYVAAVNSGVGGAYRLPSLPDGDYFVRVVNGTVSSSRSGSDGSEVPVMTYRSDGITVVADEIGGRYPALVDASANADASLLNTTTFIFSSGGLETLPAQSLQPITLNGGAVTNANFGFNFNTVVNKRAAGQGSLRQFVLNNNQLESNGIQQQLPALVTPDYSTGDSVAVLMIPPSELVSDEAVIDTMTELRIDRPGIAIDGRVQAANMGSGKIVLRGNGISLANGIYIGEEADNAALRDFSIENFGGSGVVVFGTGSTSGEGALLERLDITANGQYGVLIQNDASNSKIIANAISENTWAGISSESSSNNTFSQNSIYGNGGLGIDLGSDGVTVNSSADDWLNYPEVAAGSTISSNGSQVVTYDFDLDVPGNANGYRVEFFSNTELDPSNHGEGEIYLGHVDITSFGAGLQNFKGLVNANQSVPTEAKISVTLTEKITANSLGATSEFSGVRDGNAAVCTDLLSDPDAPLETVTVDENSGPITLLEANDANGDPITYVISGDADGNQFVITSVPGALIDCFIIEFIGGGDVIGTKDLPTSSTRAAPPTPLPGNYEAPTDGDGDNTYELLITGTDINGNTVTKPLTVTVQDVNEKPRITSSSAVSYAEEQEGAVVDLEAYDPDAGDAEGSGLTYSVSGGADARRFTIDPYTGVVNFKVAPDFNHPADKDVDNVYELTVRVADDQGYASTKSLLINVTGDSDSDVVGLRTRALLQGAYVAETGLMHDKLRVEGLLPLAQPYTDDLFAYIGNEQTDAGLLAVTGDDAIVDWVLLELRDATDSTVVIAGKAALLQRDGDIVDAITGSAELYLPVAAGQYYLSLRHRNHLGVITAAPLSFSNDANANLIDFSQPTTAVWGEHARLQVAANDDSGDIALLWSGDVNQDQRLVASGEGSDLNPILSDVLTAEENTAYNSSYQVAGYHASDLNMDGVALFMGPGNDANVLLGNVLLHPANEAFLGNYIIEGGM